MRRLRSILPVAAALAGLTVAAAAEGGTVRVAWPDSTSALPASEFSSPDEALDPQRDEGIDSEVFRCCLARTLLAFPGRPTEQGGATLLPDLAEALPRVSADGRTWTFRLRRGLRWGPPLQGVEITAQDVARGIERSARVGRPDGSRSLLRIIAGYPAYAAGRVDSVSGLETPDRHTLVVRLTRADGALAEIMALPVTAPVPPRPGDPGARFGIATGHDRRYGRHLVSSGPYMVEGSERLDPSRPPGRQPPVAGFVPGRSITLVRNPSWEPAGDPVRAAVADRLQIQLGGTPAQARAAARRLDAGGVDLVRTPPPLPSQVRRFRADPRLGRVESSDSDGLRYVVMNVAVPPFDDVHVRRALSLIVDKRAAIRTAARAFDAVPSSHLFPDSIQRGLLARYDPYATPQSRGDLRRARAEMRRSRYDRDRDGRCDAPACRDILALGLLKGGVGLGPGVAADAARVGLDLRLEELPFEPLLRRVAPANRVPLIIGLGWSRGGYPGAVFVEELFGGRGVGLGSNLSLLGATPAQLRRWRYKVRSVPSVDARIARCRRLFGASQAECLARLDQYLTERVAPYVTIWKEREPVPVPRRMTAFSWSQSTGQPALDRLAVAPPD